MDDKDGGKNGVIVFTNKMPETCDASYSVVCILSECTGDFVDSTVFQQKKDALDIIERLLPLVGNAEEKLCRARNWSFVDILGGGLFADIFKYHNIGHAKNSMDEADALLRKLSGVLGGIEIPVDYRMQFGGFSTFADFVFDGFLISDAYMAGKILSSLEQVRELERRLSALQTRLRLM